MICLFRLQSYKLGTVLNELIKRQIRSISFECKFKCRLEGFHTCLKNGTCNTWSLVFVPSHIILASICLFFMCKTNIILNSSKINQNWFLHTLYTRPPCTCKINKKSIEICVCKRIVNRKEKNVKYDEKYWKKCIAVIICTFADFIFPVKQKLKIQCLFKGFVVALLVKFSLGKSVYFNALYEYNQLKVTFHTREYKCCSNHKSMMKCQNQSCFQIVDKNLAGAGSYIYLLLYWAWNLMNSVSHCLVMTTPKSTNYVQ